MHATAQVVQFDAPVERPETAWVRGVNAMLPESVAVLWSKRVGEDFHARYSAHSRTYRYILISRPVRPALAARRAGWFHAPLDLDAMRAAALHLVGEHDFSPFRSMLCQAKNPLRSLHALTLEQRDRTIVFTLRANAFLQHMVRNIVGALVYVGKGKHPPDWLREVRDSRERANCAPTFAPEGLYLSEVEYAPGWQLPVTNGHSSFALPLA